MTIRRYNFAVAVGLIPFQIYAALLLSYAASWQHLVGFLLLSLTTAINAAYLFKGTDK